MRCPSGVSRLASHKAIMFRATVWVNPTLRASALGFMVASACMSAKAWSTFSAGVWTPRKNEPAAALVHT
jgi:hypothetical protein